MFKWVLRLFSKKRKQRQKYLSSKTMDLMKQEKKEIMAETRKYLKEIAESCDEKQVA